MKDTRLWFGLCLIAQLITLFFITIGLAPKFQYSTFVGYSILVFGIATLIIEYMIYNKH